MENIVNSGLSDNINIQNAFAELTNNNHYVENSLYWINKYLHLSSFKTPTEWAELSEKKCTGCASSMRNGVKDCKDDKIIKIKKLLEFSQANIDEAFIILDNIVSM